MKYLKTYERFSTLELEDILGEIKYDILDNPFVIEVTHILDFLFKVFKEEIEKLQNGYWFNKYSHQNKIENITEIILVSLRPKKMCVIVYDDIKDHVERAVEFMISNGFNYILEPVWIQSPGLKYSLENIKEISDKKLVGFHIKFYK